MIRSLRFHRRVLRTYSENGSRPTPRHHRHQHNRHLKKRKQTTLTENRSCIELMKRIENETSATKRLQIFKKSFETTFSNSTRFVNTMISCSLSSKLWEPIEILLQTKGLVSSSSSPELLESMLVKERLDLVK